MHDQWLNMLPDYITNSLPDEQKRDLEEHLKDCAECREALEDWYIIADVTRIKAESLKGALPPLLDVLNGTNHSRPNPCSNEFKGDKPMTSLRIPQQKSYNIPWTAVAVLLLTFFFSILLLGGLDLRPTPIQQIEGIDPSKIPADPIALLELYIDEVWNKQNLDAIPLLLSENYVHHDASMPEDIVGLEAMKEYVSTEHNILPDVSFSVEKLIANENEVIGHVTMSYEEFQTTEPVIAVIEDGKISEIWFDVGTMVEAYNVDLMSREFDMIYSGEPLTGSDLERFEANSVKLHFPNGTYTQVMQHASSANFWNMNHASCSNWHGEHSFMPQRDLVVIQTLGTCNFEASFDYWGASLEPTGYQIQNQFTWIMRIENGKVVEIWWYQNDPRFYGAIATLLSDGAGDIDPQIEAIYKLNSKSAIEEENKHIARLWVERVWNSEDVPIEDYNELVNEAGWIHHPPETFTASERTASNLSNWNRIVRRAFSDGNMTVVDIIADGDMVVVHFTWEGTHDGVFQLPTVSEEPTGERMLGEGTFVFRFEDGKIVEDWWYWDMFHPENWSGDLWGIQ